MSGDSDKVPAGWYPAPDGSQRYWDGQRWLSLPEPDRSSAATGIPTKVADSKKKVVIASVIAGIVVVVGIGYLIAKNNHDTQMQNEASAASSSQSAAAKAAADAQAERDQRERDKRKAAVKDLESDVKKLAEKQGAEGLFDGPVLSVTCDPVGGSTDNLEAKTTIFACFVATKDNGDGTLSGEKYHGTANWETNEFTYGYGAPR